jgi:hypothetical protein
MDELISSYNSLGASMANLQEFVARTILYCEEREELSSIHNELRDMRSRLKNLLISRFGISEHELEYIGYDE